MVNSRASWNVAVCRGLSSNLVKVIVSCRGSQVIVSWKSGHCVVEIGAESRRGGT
jgi:hypothetical protein